MINSHIASLAESIEAEEFSLQGHAYAIRRFGAIAFLLLRTRNEIVQVLVDSPDLLLMLSSISLETALKVKAVLGLKPGTEELEYRALAIEVLSEGCAALPVEISRRKRMESLSLNALLEYRPLTLRNQNVRAIFKIEAELCRAFREFLSQENFTEIHSPKIVATGTEGGSSLFSVDYFGSPAYLAQSPQFYKQMMVGVFERVFEIGPVYRAEEHNTARHLNEYVSMDLEMGFIESEQCLINMQIKLLKHMFESLRENCAAELALFNAVLPKFTTIPQLKLAEAVAIIESKFGWSAGSEDLDPEGERLICQYIQEEEGSELLYLTHYPWKIRPFYAMPESGSQKSHSFDLLYRGLEITTGGQRIHQYQDLRQSISKRGMEPEKFADYLQCFQYGMPPHGGLAIGLERLAKQILDLKNVREASLFPRDRSRISP